MDASSPSSVHQLPIPTYDGGQLLHTQTNRLTEFRLTEFMRGPRIAVGFEGLVDRADQLPRPAGPLGSKPDRGPLRTGEEFLSVNVAVPLASVRC
jgi:hypothetical protein